MSKPIAAAMRYVLSHRLLIFLLVSLLFLSGCASHSDRMSQATDMIRNGDYVAAETLANTALDQDRNTLLRLMETGVIRHLQGDYAGSNALLHEADQLADELYTTSMMDLATRLSTNATLVTYRSQIHERIYIHYYKILNYIFLGEQSDDQHELQELLDAARVETNRVRILLDENLHKVGDYAQAEDERGRLINRVLDIFASLNGDMINPRELVFRDSAFTHYMIGTLHERLGELDNARISYERAATTYEQGYVQQYDLDEGIVNQAWFDVARILKTQDDERWQRVAQDKLTTQQRLDLEQWDPATQAQLLVIHEVDMMPPRGELNLYMNLQGDYLTISPILMGDESEQLYQLAWFYYLYADRGLMNAIERLQSDTYHGRLADPHQKTVNIGMVRSAFDEVGLTDILTSTGVRLTVPYFRYDDSPFTGSSLSINGAAQIDMLDADNIAGLVMAQHLIDARSELTEAMAIESLRLVLCVQTGMPSFVCSAAAAASTAADTRLWLTLPNRIRITRQLLSPGEYALHLEAQAGIYSVDEQETRTLHPGQLAIWRVRNFALSSDRTRTGVVSSDRTPAGAASVRSEKSAEAVQTEKTLVPIK